MSRDPARPAAGTGLGAITPIGLAAETFWRSLLAGTSGVAQISAYDPSGEEVRIAAEVKGFDPITWIDFKQARRMSRFSQFAVAGAAQGIAGAGRQVPMPNADQTGA